MGEDIDTVFEKINPFDTRIIIYKENVMMKTKDISRMIRFENISIN